MAHVSHKLSGSVEGALAGGGDPATSPLYVFGPFLRMIFAAGVASVVFGAAIWLAVFLSPLHPGLARRAQHVRRRRQSRVARGGHLRSVLRAGGAGPRPGATRLTGYRDAACPSVSWKQPRGVYRSVAVRRTGTMLTGQIYMSERDCRTLRLGEGHTPNWLSGSARQRLGPTFAQT